MKLTLIFLLLSLLISGAYAQQESYFFQQRAIMLSELEHQKNIDLMMLDPETCKFPLTKEKRIQALKANIDSFSRNGKFDHCKNLKFKGARKVTNNLHKQRLSVLDIQKMNGQNEGISTTKKTSEAQAQQMLEVMEPEDNTTPPEYSQLLPNEGSSPSPYPLLSGYVGIPYSSSMAVDEVFSFYGNVPNTPDFMIAPNLPPGLTIGVGASTQNHGNVVGVPRVAGFFTPQVEVGVLGMGITTVFRGPVKLQILPEPKYTVLDPRARSTRTATLSSEFPPLLNVKFKDLDNRGKKIGSHECIQSVHGFRSGKHYIEVKINEMGDGKSLGPSNLFATMGFMAIKEGVSCFGSFGAGSILIRDKYPIYQNAMQTDWVPHRKGNTVMIAIDADKKLIWYGVDGRWSSMSEMPNPAKGTGRYQAYGDSLASRIKSNPQFMSDNLKFSIEGSRGSSFTVNFGDQPFKYEPPEGFTGIPNTGLSLPIANLWDTNSSPVRSVILDNHYGASYGVGTMAWAFPWAYGQKGDIILGMTPRRTGRWQFEVAPFGYGDRAKVGIAPTSLAKRTNISLGEKGSGSIGAVLMEDYYNSTGKGRIEIEGEITYFDNSIFERGQGRFTFDVNLDSGDVVIYGNGKELLKTKLPATSVKEWAPAATLAGGSAELFNLDPKLDYPEIPRDFDTVFMKYPVSGAQFWTMGTKACTHCSTSAPVLAADEHFYCDEAEYNVNGNLYSSEKPEFDHCTLPKTPEGYFGTCKTPERPLACTPNKFGGFFCEYQMQDYDTADRCQKECKVPVKTVKKQCLKSGWH